MDPLPCCKQRVEEQKCWTTAIDVLQHRALKVRIQCRRRRWNIDKWPKSKMQKEKN